MDSKKLAKIAIKKVAMQKVKELSSLISFLKKRKLNVIVEIGTARGGTFYAWCKIAQPKAVIISIDLPNGIFGGGYTLNDVKKFRKYKQSKQELYFLRNDSHKQSTKKKLIKILNGNKIDFLMIDGDHRYAGVKKDFQLYSPLVKQNGIIAFHDILFHPEIPKCKVDKLWNEIKINYKHKEFVDKNDVCEKGQWGGIGIIYYDNIKNKRKLIKHI